MGQIRDLITNKHDPKQTLNKHMGVIQEKNADLNCFIGNQLSDADKAIQSLSGKESGKLYGIPIAVKDNLNVEGWDVTCSSNILKGYKAPYNATVIDRLLAEGAVLMGSVNMDEFAFGSSCETSCYGPTKNPWNQECVPGGSSGGSAAAVASQMAVASLGSDTGGSIRQPASFCGVVGLKPTYGRVSRYGLVAFASSLDQIGPFTQSVEDAAILLEVMAGKDDRDSTCADLPVPEYSKTFNQSVKGMRIGIPKEFTGDEADSDVRACVQASIESLKGLGVEFVEVSLPHTQYAIPVYYVIGPCEASSNLGRFDGVRFGARDTEAASLLEMYVQTREKGFGTEAKRRIILGTSALSSGYYDQYYVRAMKVRSKIISEFNEVFKTVDALITPTSPTGAFRIGEKTTDPLSMYLSDIYTISANLAGIPAISVPGGLTQDKMPIGIQFMAKPFAEETLFQIAHAYESQVNFAENCVIARCA
ncbi:MAG: aspartyl-tRNA(Asn)/glutamyl-tRNA(Gln) amidotransferase subunit A [Candidatus Omnitrophota bacterium]|jgi:aspartyl-tRNA(Asn)/glutamyl-tRNA(Gln) amidotransferase subunit A